VSLYILIIWFHLWNETETSKSLTIFLTIIYFNFDVFEF